MIRITLKLFVKPGWLCVIPLLFLCTWLQGQEVTFNASEWDFGRLQEAEGAVEHSFAFRNNSGRPLRIGAVTVSCSCIQATYPHEEIPAGGTGAITVRFSPAGAAGKTFRYVDVYSQENHFLGRLSAVADVEPIDLGLEERYRTVLGGPLRAHRRSLPFGYVREGESATKEIYLANVGDRPVRLQVLPSALEVEAPEEIPPKGEVPLRVTFRAKGAYHSFHDQLRLLVDGVPAEQAIPVSALCLGPAPKPGASLWTLPSEAPLRHGRGTIELGNSGSEDLVILGVETPEGVQVNLKAGTRIGPGSKVKVKARSALPSFEILIFTNDPARPYKELRYKL